VDVTIARIAAEHADGFHRVLDIVAREREYLAILEAPPLDSSRKFISDNIAKGYPQFVALAGGDVVGWCDVLPKKFPVYSHCGGLGMGLLPEWRGRGNGTALIRATLSEARLFGFVRIELMVYADNAQAIALYEKVGFKTEGVMRDAALIDGLYRDSILMAIVDRSNAARVQPAAQPT
jgi:RimJ/RimL family protein N-acetyltransferase